jgi:uncharacterized protein (TIGR02266 family)
MYKILLADDVKLTLASERSYLEGKNLKVFATASASEAKEMAGVLQPDVVVLDYEMPEMTGADVCRDLRDSPLTAHIPVLILSIRDDEEIVRICEQAGAVGFVRKADGRDALLESVARILGIPQRRHLRVPCRFTVGIVEGGRIHTGTLQNVSEGGIFLTTGRRFEAGMALRLRFNLPGVKDVIQVLGEIVRIEEITNDEEYGFGIQFLEMTDASRQGLKTFLDTSI